MKGTNVPKTTIDTGEQALLEELFSDSDHLAILNLDGSYTDAIGTLIQYATAVGGMVTFYRGSAGDYIGISVRLGKRKRALSISGDDIDRRELEQFTDGFKRLWLHQSQLANAAKLDEQALKTKKAKP